MAYNSQWSIAGRNALAQGGLLAALAGGLFRVYTGAQPANGDASITGTKLLEIPLGSPAGTVTNGVISLADPTPVSPIVNGTAGYMTLTKADGTVLMMGSVGTSGSNLNLSTLTFDTTIPVDIGVYTITIDPSIAGQ